MESEVRSSYLHVLSKGIASEWAEGKFSDVEVIVEGQKFNCHRIILASVSEYFSVMFTSGKIMKQVKKKRNSKFVYNTPKVILYH